MNDPFNPDRRRLFSTSLPAMGVIAAGSAVPVAPPAPRPFQSRTASVIDFGAKGDGRTDDSAAFAAALAAAQVVVVPPGSYLLTRPVVLRDGQALQGAGSSGWEPYSGTGVPASAVRSELLLADGIAIDARNTNNALISGLALRSRGARQSRWAYEPGQQRGTTGIDIAGALQFHAQDISFHGLEIGVSAVADSGRTAQMPVIENWSAHDCATVFRFASTAATFTPVRDARIAACSAALHCGRVVEVRNCDGLRVENVRFFQCVRNALLIENTPFVAIIGTTMFETGDETVVLRGCNAVTISGVQFVRAGLYHAPPRVQRAAVLLENCRDIAFSGLIERPMGRAFSVRDCRNLSISGTIAMPFWSTGSLGSNDAAVFVERSQGITINASFSGNDYWLAVAGDADSAGSIVGTIAVEGMAGVLRCVRLQPAPLGHITRLPVAQTVPPGATIGVDTLRIPVQPRGVLVTRSVELTMEGALVRIGDQLLAMRGGETAGGSLSIERKSLYRNDTATTRYTTLVLGIHNPTSQPVSTPAGVEMRLSLAIE